MFVTFLAVVVPLIRVRWLGRTLRLVFYLPGPVDGEAPGDLREPYSDGRSAVQRIAP